MYFDPCFSLGVVSRPVIVLVRAFGRVGFGSSGSLFGYPNPCNFKVPLCLIQNVHSTILKKKTIVSSLLFPIHLSDGQVNGIRHQEPATPFIYI
jgi:hypothetical protein